MSTTTEAPVPSFTRMAQSWNRFWFTPSDPTTLGAIRIFCGVLTLYTHLAYTYDLRAFVV